MVQVMHRLMTQPRRQPRCAWWQAQRPPWWQPPCHTRCGEYVQHRRHLSAPPPRWRRPEYVAVAHRETLGQYRYRRHHSSAPPTGSHTGTRWSAAAQSPPPTRVPPIRSAHRADRWQCRAAVCRYRFVVPDCRAAAAPARPASATCGRRAKRTREAVLGWLACRGSKTAMVRIENDYGQIEHSRRGLW